MFTNPIKHTRLTSMKELLKFSYRTDSHSENKLVVTQNNGQVAFADEYGCVYVTPYRPEVHAILSEAGYSEKYCLFVPFSNGENRPDAYQWLAKIAEEECWAYTHEKAYQVATEKGIKSVTLRGKYQIKEISYYDDTETHTTYSALTTMFLFSSKENIGTYIVIDEKTIMVCDEYGRTFLLKSKTVINDTVNILLDAGYTRTAHPEWFIHHYEPVKPEE